MNNSTRLTITSSLKGPSYRLIDLEKSSKKRSNKLSLSNSGLLTPLKLTFQELFSLPAFWWYLFIISIEFTPYCPKLSLKPSLVLPLTLIIILRALKHLLLNKRQAKINEKLNSQPVGIFNGSDFSVLTSSQIYEGDLILLRTHESAPCDCFILSVESPNDGLFVKLIELDDFGQLQSKKPIKVTHNLLLGDDMTIEDMIKYIETVKVIQPNVWFETISGKVKIKGSPTDVMVTNENFLRAGTVVTECEWVLCLAVYVGKDCKRWVKYKINNSKFTSRSERILSVLFWVCLGVMAVVIILNAILYEDKFGLRFGDKGVEAVFQIIILYSNLLPVSLYLALEVFELTRRVQVNMQDERVIVRNSKSLENLHSIEYIVAEKTGVLTDKEISVQCCLCIQSNFLVNYSESVKKEVSIPAVDEEFEQLRRSNSSIGESSNRTFEELKSELRDKRSAEANLLMGVSMLLCNNYTTKDCCNCVNPVENAIIEFAGTLGFRISGKTQKIFVIEFNSSQHSFTIVGSNRQSSGSVFKCVIKEESSGRVYLLYKGDKASVCNLLSDSKHLEALGNIKNYSRYEGVCKMFYLFKSMNFEDFCEFVQDYNIAKRRLVNKEQMIDSSFDYYSKDMKLLSVVGYENNIKQETIECVETLMETGIKIVIASSVSKESVLATAHQLKMIPPNTKVPNLKGFKTSSEAIQKIKKILSTKSFNASKEEPPSKRSSNSLIKHSDVRTSRKRSVNNPFLVSLGYEQDVFENFHPTKSSSQISCVCIHGATLRLAFNSKELLKGILFLMFSSKSVLFYKMLPQLKRRLVKVIRKNFDFKPAVLAVGNSDGALQMVAEADIGVKVADNLAVPNWYKDIHVKSFADLEKLIMKVGSSYNHSYQVIISLTVFKEFCVLTLLFLYQTRCAFSGTPVIDFDLIVLYELLLSFVFVFLLGWQNSEKTWNESRCSGNKTLSNSIIVNAFVGVFHGILIYVFVDRGFMIAVNSSGLTEDFGTIGVTCFIMVNFSLFVQGFFHGVTFKVLFKSIGTSFVLLVAVLIGVSYSDLAENPIASDLYTQNTVTWKILCLLPLFLYTFTCFVYFFAEKLRSEVKTRFEAYRNKTEKVFTDNGKFKSIATENEISFDNWKMKFKDSSLEKEYKDVLYTKMRKHLKIYTIIIFASTLIDGFLSVYGYPSLINNSIAAFVATGYFILLIILSFIITGENIYGVKLLLFIALVALNFQDIFTNTSVILVSRYPIFTLLFCLDLSTNWNYSLAKSLFFTSSLY